VSAAGDGTASGPGIGFADDTNTGFFRPGADILAAQRVVLSGGAWMRLETSVLVRLRQRVFWTSLTAHPVRFTFLDPVFPQVMARLASARCFSAMSRIISTLHQSKP
jgi:hypothetical protein